MEAEEEQQRNCLICKTMKKKIIQTEEYPDVPMLLYYLMSHRRSVRNQKRHFTTSFEEKKSFICSVQPMNMKERKSKMNTFEVKVYGALFLTTYLTGLTVTDFCFSVTYLFTKLLLNWQIIMDKHKDKGH